jgi:UDP-N-acetylglucosamine diphosphorylase / glucose-1-phosphate thymidylyltransferase / UDP-N-acetylgalactosamine diphosphorylase / glucosamine-1-phosphate N-acetyltransferase / galactosamine-1-phosphate N-acetyltransferase
MKINIIGIGAPDSFQPIISEKRSVKDCSVGGTTLEKALTARIKYCVSNIKCNIENRFFNIRVDLWPSIELIEKILLSNDNTVFFYKLGDEEIPMAWASSKANKIPDNINNKAEIDNSSKILRYSWDLLTVNEELIDSIKEDVIKGTVRERVTIDGNVIIGEGTVLLPGVYIEGNAVIGKNCKIGPNCYIRGKTHIGDNCHVGQAVEIKNSILMNKASVGHLSYVGDSIIGENTNFGAGTTTANLRHDGSNHHSKIGGKQIDTGRRKLGVIVGDNVHTGINTSIYPGRKLWPSISTLPGEVVKKDIQKSRF